MSPTMKESACDFLDRAIRAHLTGHEVKKIDKTEVGFISDRKVVTFNHYMDQPKSMNCRKKRRRFFEVKSEDINDFEYNWIPSCLI